MRMAWVLYFSLSWFDETLTELNWLSMFMCIEVQLYFISKTYKESTFSLKHSKDNWIIVQMGTTRIAFELKIVKVTLWSFVKKKYFPLSHKLRFYTTTTFLKRLCHSLIRFKSGQIVFSSCHKIITENVQNDYEILFN